MASSAMAGIQALWGRYQAQLARRPVRTQVISSGLLWAVGDVVAQAVEHTVQKKKELARKAQQSSAFASPPKDGDKRGEKNRQESSWNLDLERAAKTSLFGFGFVGPVGHYWYEGLEYLVREKFKFPVNSGRFVGSKLVFDTGLFGPIHLLAFFTYMGLASGKSFPEVKTDIRRDFLPTFMTEGTMWFLVQIANFRFIPVRNQLLVVNCFCIADSAFLSWVKHQEDAPWKRYLTSLVTSSGSKES